MKNNTLVIVILVLLLSVAVYFLGKKNGSNDTQIKIVQNIEMVKQIAELSALSVTGTTSVKVTNASDNRAMWDKFKNYFAENTLLVTVPFEAKYGVDLSQQKLSIDANEKTATVYLPKCNLLSLQLRLDQLETMNKTGLFANTTLNDLAIAQKQLYEQAVSNMTNNAQHITEAELHIQQVLAKYYEPLGFKVQCIFDNKAK